MNGLFSTGGALGSLSTAYTAEAFGRLRTIQLACLVCILGAALMTGAVNIPMFLASRFIMGWGVGQIVCAGKSNKISIAEGFFTFSYRLDQCRCTRQSYPHQNIVACM